MSILEHAQNCYASSDPRPQRALSGGPSLPTFAAGPEHNSAHSHGYDQEIYVPCRVKQCTQNEHVPATKSHRQIPEQQDGDEQEQQVRIRVKLHQFFPEITPCSNIKSARRW